MEFGHDSDENPLFMSSHHRFQSKEAQKRSFQMKFGSDNRYRFRSLNWLGWEFLRTVNEKSDILARDAISKFIHSATWIKWRLMCTDMVVIKTLRKFRSHLANSVQEKASTPLLNRPNRQMIRTQTLIFSFKHRSPDPFSWWVGSNDA